MGFQAAPPEIRSLVFDLLAKPQRRSPLPFPEYNVRHILNTMLTCKQLHPVGLPYLYRDVYLNSFQQAYSFFVAIHQYGRLVRRVRIKELCRAGPRAVAMGNTDHHSFCQWNGHITTRDRLVSLAKLCPNLQTFLVDLDLHNGSEDYNPFGYEDSQVRSVVGWFQEFVQLCPNLEVLIPPMQCITYATVRTIYCPLTQLKELYLTDAAFDFEFRQIAGHFPQLRKLSLFRWEPVSLRDFRHFVDLAPNLDIVDLNQVEFSDSNDGENVDDKSASFPNPENVGEDLVELSGRGRLLIVKGGKSLAEVLPIGIAPTGWFSKLRGLDVSVEYYLSIEQVLDLVQRLPLLEAIHMSPKDAARLFTKQTSLPESFFERIKVFSRPPQDSKFVHNCGTAIARRKATIDKVRKAIEDGLVQCDWDEKWGWRANVRDDPILYHWHS